MGLLVVGFIFWILVSGFVHSTTGAVGTPGSRAVARATGRGGASAGKRENGFNGPPRPRQTKVADVRHG